MKTGMPGTTGTGTLAGLSGNRSVLALAALGGQPDVAEGRETLMPSSRDKCTSATEPAPKKSLVDNVHSLINENNYSLKISNLQRARHSHSIVAGGFPEIS